MLAEPGPQRSDRSLRYSSGNAPLLVAATLAHAAADDVDTLSFLTARALEDRKEVVEEEEEEREKAKRTLRRFSGPGFMLPDAQGQSLRRFSVRGAFWRPWTSRRSGEG